MKVLYALVIFSAVLFVEGCKPKAKWDKDTLVNNCLKDFYKKNETEKKFTGMQIPNLCDCISEKLVANYKSEAESDKDHAGVTKIGYDCATKVLNQ